MKTRTIHLFALTVTAGAVLGGCALLSHSPAPSATLIAFNYTIDNGRAAGIDHAFDMNGSTVLQLNGSSSAAPKLFDIGGDQIYYKPLGQYLVLSGIHNQVRVVVDGNHAVVKRRATAAAQVQRDLAPAARTVAVAETYVAPTVAPAEPVIARQTTPEATERDDTRAELARIREELQKVKAMLAEAAQSNRAYEPPRAAYAPPPKAYTTPVESAKVIRVTFKFNSTDFEPAPDAATSLASTAQRARRIVIRGFTDSEKFSQSELVLANNRAQAARRFLISKGVDDSKIVVSAQAFGGFVANNKTPAGRAQNRRVDIEFL